MIDRYGKLTIDARIAIIKTGVTMVLICMNMGLFPRHIVKTFVFCFSVAQLCR